MPDDRINDVSPERLLITRGITDVVKQAATILQKEVNEGAKSSNKMQEEYARTKKVDPNEFKALSQRVRKDVHDLIAMFGEMFTELRTDEVQTLVSRMATDAHEVVDTTMNLVENTPAAAGAFARFGFTNPATGPTPSGEPPVPGAEPGEQPGGRPAPPSA